MTADVPFHQLHLKNDPYHRLSEAGFSSCPSTPRPSMVAVLALTALASAMVLSNLLPISCSMGLPRRIHMVPFLCLTQSSSRTLQGRVNVLGAMGKAGRGKAVERTEQGEEPDRKDQRPQVSPLFFP